MGGGSSNYRAEGVLEIIQIETLMPATGSEDIFEHTTLINNRSQCIIHVPVFRSTVLPSSCEVRGQFLGVTAGYSDI